MDGELALMICVGLIGMIALEENWGPKEFGWLIVGLITFGGAIEYTLAYLM